MASNRPERKFFKEEKTRKAEEKKRKALAGEKSKSKSQPQSKQSNKEESETSTHALWMESDWLRLWEFETRVGTVPHKFLEQTLLNLLNQEEFRSAPQEVQKAFNGIWENLRKTLAKGWKIIGSEIYLPDFQKFCCGAADLILQSTKKGEEKKFMIVDFKTTSATLSEMRRTISSKSSTLGISNTKLNSYCIQVNLYRNAFLKLFDWDAFNKLGSYELYSLEDQTTNNIKKHKITVEVALCTPQEWIDLSAKEFEKFSTLARKLLNHYYEIARQIRSAKRFCQLDLFKDSFDARFPQETDEDILYHMETLLTRSPIFGGMKKLSESVLKLVPTFSEFDMQTLFSSDRFCSRRDGQTTEKRAKLVLSGGEVVLRSCFDIGQNMVCIYLSATGTSSRGASKKHSIIVFTVYPDNVITIASRCDCILGQTRSCAHRCRLLLELRKLQFHETQKKQRGMDVSKRIELFEKIGKSEANSRKRAEKPKSSRKNAKKQCTASSRMTSSTKARETLLLYLPLPLRTGNLTKEKLKRIQTEIRTRYEEASLPDTTWPNDDEYQKKMINGLFRIHQLLPRASDPNADDSEDRS